MSDSDSDYDCNEFVNHRFIGRIRTTIRSGGVDVPSSDVIAKIFKDRGISKDEIIAAARSIAADNRCEQHEYTMVRRIHKYKRDAAVCWKCRSISFCRRCIAWLTTSDEFLTHGGYLNDMEEGIINCDECQRTLVIHKCKCGDNKCFGKCHGKGYGFNIDDAFV